MRTLGLLLVFVLVAVLPASTLSAQQQFFPLRAHGTDEDYDFSAQSNVESLSAQDPRAQKLVAFMKELEKSFGPLDKNGPFYLYTYTFTSKGKYKIKVNFSGWEFVHSPLTDILQDFSFVMQPGETKVVRFVSYGKPQGLETPINVGIWKKDADFGDTKERWHFAGIGKAGFYAPPSLAFYVAVP